MSGKNIQSRKEANIMAQEAQAVPEDEEYRAYSLGRETNMRETDTITGLSCIANGQVPGFGTASAVPAQVVLRRDHQTRHRTACASTSTVVVGSSL